LQGPRLKAAQNAWEAKQQALLGERWKKYWEAWRLAGPGAKDPPPPKAMRATPWWKERFRKAATRELRRVGVRVRR
jgi:hypothetical protein